jgi:SAM-dependent methyltransferase
VADDYDRARPGYPIDAVRWLAGPRRIEIVDLGAGTGKLTGGLVAEGHRVVAVEPLAELRAKLTDRFPEVPAVAGRAEAIPLPDACADAVLVGQAFHWFDRAPAMAEVARVLRPGGVLGLIWNFRDDRQPWMAALSAITRPNGLPAGWTGELEALAPAAASIARREFRLAHPVDRETLAALVRSWSYVACLDEPEREDVLRRVAALWDEYPEMAGRATVTYRTEAVRIVL